MGACFLAVLVFGQMIDRLMQPVLGCTAFGGLIHRIPFLDKNVMLDVDYDWRIQIHDSPDLEANFKASLLHHRVFICFIFMNLLCKVFIRPVAYSITLIVSSTKCSPARQIVPTETNSSQSPPNSLRLLSPEIPEGAGKA